MIWAILITITLNGQPVLKAVVPDFATSSDECVEKANQIPLQWGPTINSDEDLHPHIEFNCVEQPERSL